MSTHRSRPPLDLVIRFSADIPDLSLPVPSPASATILALKHEIRQHIPSSLRPNSLRLIHAGKVLPDTATLSSCVKLPVPPPPRSANVITDKGTELSEKAKGKLPDRGGEGREVSTQETEHVRTWIHCSISDTILSEAALAAEEEAASTYHDPSTPSPTSTQCAGPALLTDIDQPEHRTTTPGPQGFDRLLGAGFTAADIAQLREQLRQELSYTHTPDTMPTGPEVLAHEERWLDSSAFPNDTAPLLPGSAGNRNGTSRGWLSLGGLFGGGNSGTQTGGVDLQDDDVGHDDNLYGSMIGFFWPVGAFMLGYREEGVWTRRRWLAVMARIAGNLIVGFLKMSG